MRQNSHQKIYITRIQTKSLNCVVLHVVQHRMRSAELHALALVFEKSATEPKLNLLRGQNTSNIASFMILNSTNQQPQLTASAAYKNIDIVCVQEYRYYHCELELKCNEHLCQHLMLILEVQKCLAANIF